MPVRSAAVMFHIEAKQHHARSAPEKRQAQRLKAGVPAGKYQIATRRIDAGRGRDIMQLENIEGFAIAGPEFRPWCELVAVLEPPKTVHSEQHISERREPNRIVNRDYSSVFGFESPPADGFTVFCCEAGAARDADDFAFPPAAEIGDFLLLGVVAIILLAAGPFIFTSPLPINSFARESLHV